MESRPVNSTRAQLERAYGDAEFQRTLRDTHEGRVSALCSGIAASGPQGMQQQIDEHWRRVGRDEAALARRFPQHRAVISDLRINARSFQQGLSQAAYTSTCEGRGVRVRGSQTRPNET